jgi:myo-inositol-1(or 4)-monophosphatase
VRRPGAAALDLCYVAAGWYDGFFETGLQPWDVAAGSLIVTEAGGLVGNFTGEADYLHQRELVAGNPRIYGQLVQTLAPYTRVIRQDAAAAEGGAAAPADATQAFLDAAAPAEAGDAPAPAAAPAPARKAVRIRKAAAAAPAGDDAPF